MAAPPLGHPAPAIDDAFIVATRNAFQADYARAGGVRLDVPVQVASLDIDACLRHDVALAGMDTAGAVDVAPLVGDVINIAMALALRKRTWDPAAAPPRAGQDWIAPAPNRPQLFRLVVLTAVQQYDVDPIGMFNNAAGLADGSVDQLVAAAMCLAHLARIARQRPGLAFSVDDGKRNFFVVCAPRAVAGGSLIARPWLGFLALCMMKRITDAGGAASDPFAVRGNRDEFVQGKSKGNALLLPVVRPEVIRYRFDDDVVFDLTHPSLHLQYDAIVEGALGVAFWAIREVHIVTGPDYDLGDELLAEAMLIIADVAFQAIGSNVDAPAWPAPARLLRRTGDAFFLTELFGVADHVELPQSERVTVQRKLDLLGLSLPDTDIAHAIYVPSPSDGVFEAMACAILDGRNPLDPDEDTKRAVGVLVGVMAIGLRLAVGLYTHVAHCAMNVGTADNLRSDPFTNRLRGNTAAQIQLTDNLFQNKDDTTLFPSAVHPLAMASPLGQTAVEYFAAAQRIAVADDAPPNNWDEDLNLREFNDAHRNTHSWAPPRLEHIPRTGFVLLASNAPGGLSPFTGLRFDAASWDTDPVVASRPQDGDPTNQGGGLAVLLAPSSSRPIWSVLPVAREDGLLTPPLLRWDAQRFFRILLGPDEFDVTNTADFDRSATQAGLQPVRTGWYGNPVPDALSIGCRRQVVPSSNPDEAGDNTAIARWLGSADCREDRDRKRRCGGLHGIDSAPRRAADLRWDTWLPPGGLAEVTRRHSHPNFFARAE